MINNRKLFTSLLLIISFSVNFSAESKDFDHSECAKDFISFVAKESLSTLSNKLSKSIAARILLGSPVDVHIGGKKNDNLKLLKKGLFKKPLTINGIMITEGWSEIKKSKSIIKNIIVELIGPISGSITLFLINIAANSIKHENWNTKDKILRSFLDPRIFYHLLDNLIPSKGNCGENILKEFYPESTITETFGWKFVIEVIFKGSVQSEISSITKKVLRNNYEDFNVKTEEEFNLKKDVELGYDCIMSLFNKILCASNELLTNYDMKISDTDLDVLDILNIWNIFTKHIPNIKKKYYK